MFSHTTRFPRPVVLCLSAWLASAGLGVCIGAPADTLWLSVTLYDFNSDESNPEFNQGACDNGTIDRGMVQDTLDEEGKPVLKQNMRCNQNVDRWFRENNGGSFNDVIIEDSLPFINTGSGNRYIYQNKAFFPLDNKGLVAAGQEHQLGPWGDGPVWFQQRGGDPREYGLREPHNYSFTMEMRHTFVYKGGEYFEFVGDDDAWIFIAGQLALDLGGIHFEQSGSFYLDDLAAELGLEVGLAYELSFFYAERRIIMSTVSIETNIMPPETRTKTTVAESPPRTNVTIVAWGGAVLGRSSLRSATMDNEVLLFQANGRLITRGGRLSRGRVTLHVVGRAHGICILSAKGSRTTENKPVLLSK